MIEAPVQQHLRVGVVVLHHELAVPFRGVRTGAFMEYRTDSAGEPITLSPLKELALIHIIGDIEIRQVSEPGSVSQIINHQDIGFAAPVEAMHDIGTDKAGSTSHDNHQKTPTVTIWAGRSFRQVSLSIIAFFKGL